MNYRSKRISENMAVALFFGLVLMFVSFFIFSAVNFKSENLKLAFSILSSFVRLAVPSAIFVLMQKSSGFERAKISDEGSVGKKYSFMLTFIGFVLVFVLGMLYAMAFPTASADIYTGGGILTVLLSVISYAVLPAVMEEILYRDLFCREMTVCGNGFAIIISALIFGLTHYSFDIFPYAFVCGLIMGYVYLSTRSVKYTVAIHFLNNFLSYALSVLYSNVDRKIYTAVTIPIVVVLCVAAMIMLYFLVPNSKVLSRGYDSAATSSFLTFPIVVFGICAVIVNLL